MAIAGLVETTTGAAVDADTRYPLTTSSVLLTSDERAGLSLVAITESNPPVTAATRQTPTVELGEGTALVIPAEHASYRAAITADAATLTLTPPASGSVEIAALVRSRTVGQAALSIDTEDAYFSVSLDADTYARTAYLLIGGANVEGELTLALSDDSAADVVIPLTCVGTEWRRVAVSYRAGAASESLDITWAQTSATGALYWQSVAVEGPAPDTGSALLTAALQAAPSRVDLTATGRTDWALWGRTDASTIDRKAGVTAQIGTLGVTGATAARVASAGSTWAFEDAAPAISQELTLAGVTPFWGCGGTPVDLIPAGGLVRLWAEVFADGSATVDAAVYLPTAATTAPPRLTTVAVTPVQVQLATGTMQQFTAAGYDQYGESYTLAGGTWAASGGGTISTSGLFTASAVGGPYTVTYTEGDPQGAPVVGTASVTVSAASGTGLLQASSAEVADSTTVNLTSIGTDDWVHLGLADADDRNEQDGSTLIGTITRLGTGTSGRWYGAGVQPKWAWSDGTPTASEAGTYGYWDITLASAGIGDGWTGTIAADTDEHTASFWVRTYQTTGTLSLSLSDGADEPLAINLGDLSSTKYYRVDVTYRADDTGETLDWRWEQTHDAGNTGLAAIAVTVGSDPVALTSIAWTPASVTLMEGASTVAVPLALDQYSRPMAGTELDLSVGAGVTATPDPVTSGAQVTITAGASAVGSYTLTAENGAVSGDLGITVEDYVPPAEFPTISWDQAVIDWAMDQSPVNLSTTNDAPSGAAAAYLALVAIHDGNMTRTGAAKTVAERVAEHVASVLQAGSFGQRRGSTEKCPSGGTTDWYHNPVYTILACARRSSVWDLLSAETQGRADWAMRFGLYVGQMMFNPAHWVSAQTWNDCSMIPWKVGTGHSAPNQRTGIHALLCNLIYWEDLSTVNAQLANWSKAAMHAAIAQYGWTGVSQIWGPDALYGQALFNAMEYGAELVSTYNPAYSNHYTSLGVREPWLNIIVPTITNVRLDSWWTHDKGRSTSIPITVRNIIEWELRRQNWGFPVKDANCGLRTGCSPNYGYLLSGSTPYQNEPVMPLEYANWTRSSHKYVMGSVAIKDLHQVAMALLLGHWPSPDGTLDPILADLRKGAEVFWYRDALGWADTEVSPCGSTALSDYYGVRCLRDITQKVLYPAHAWPDDPV